MTSEQRSVGRRGKPGKCLGGEHDRRREQPVQRAGSWGTGGTPQSSKAASVHRKMHCLLQCLISFKPHSSVGWHYYHLPFTDVKN